MSLFWSLKNEFRNLVKDIKWRQISNDGHQYKISHALKAVRGKNVLNNHRKTSYGMQHSFYLQIDETPERQKMNSLLESNTGTILQVSVHYGGNFFIGQVSHSLRGWTIPFKCA